MKYQLIKLINLLYYIFIYHITKVIELIKFDS